MKYSKQISETERWWNSKNILKFDSQYKESYFDKTVTLYQNSRMNKVYEFINEQKFKNILEVGFGAGQLIKKIIKNKKNIDYYGIEISKPLLNKTKQRIKKVKSNSRVKLSIQNVDKGLKFKKNKFDIIVAVGVFHYSSNINKGLKEIYKILKKDGIFIIAQRSGYAFSFLFNLRYLLRSILYLLSNEKYELFPSYRSILCDSNLGVFSKKFQNKKFLIQNLCLKIMTFINIKLKRD